MVEFIGILLAVLAALFIGYPIYRAQKYQLAFDSNHRASDLEAQKAEIYKAIKDIEFDYQMGKLSEEDYTELRDQYKTQAIEILKKIDARAMGAARRGPGGQGTQKHARARFCHQCGASIQKGDKFCSNCGTAL